LPDNGFSQKTKHVVSNKPM